MNNTRTNCTTCSTMIYHYYFDTYSKATFTSIQIIQNSIFSPKIIKTIWYLYHISNLCVLLLCDSFEKFEQFSEELLWKRKININYYCWTWRNNSPFFWNIFNSVSVIFGRTQIHVKIKTLLLPLRLITEKKHLPRIDTNSLLRSKFKIQVHSNIYYILEICTNQY